MFQRVRIAFYQRYKRESRGDENTEKQFTCGHRQGIPSDFNELLKISSFKSDLLRFLFKKCEDPVHSAILEKKIFYCATINESVTSRMKH